MLLWRREFLESLTQLHLRAGLASHSRVAVSRGFSAQGWVCSWKEKEGGGVILGLDSSLPNPFSLGLESGQKPVLQRVS